MSRSSYDKHKASGKKNTKRKTHPRVIEELKESIRAIIITKQILDLRINFTINKQLVSAPTVKKQLIKVITKNNAIQFRVNSLNIDNYKETLASYFCYSISSLKTNMLLENALKALVLINTGTKINVLNKKVMENASLAMRHDF